VGGVRGHRGGPGAPQLAAAGGEGGVRDADRNRPGRLGGEVAPAHVGVQLRIVSPGNFGVFLQLSAALAGQAKPMGRTK